MRSLWQSVICSDGVVGLRRTLVWIAHSFLYDTAGVDHRSLSLLACREADGTASMVTLDKRLERFLERLAGQLVNHLCSLAQNRSRGKRRLAASYTSLLDLSAEAAALDASLTEKHPSHSSLSTAAVQALTLDTMLHIVFSGFELELHRMQECAFAYGLAHRIAEEQSEVLERIMQCAETTTQDRHLHQSSKVHFTQALAEASKAMQVLFRSPSVVRHASLPWQPFAEDCWSLQNHPNEDSSTNDALEALHRVSFAKRFKWLQVKGRPEASQTLDNLWSELQADKRETEAKSVSGERVGVRVE